MALRLYGIKALRRHKGERRIRRLIVRGSKFQVPGSRFTDNKITLGTSNLV